MRSRLNASPDRRGRPLTEILADWAADNPQIGRVWLFRGRAGPVRDAIELVCERAAG